MKTYTIEIYSLGYETYTCQIQRPSKRHVTKTDVLKAKVEWCKLNDLDEDTCTLPSHRISSK